MPRRRDYEEEEGVDYDQNLPRTMAMQVRQRQLVQGVLAEQASNLPVARRLERPLPERGEEHTWWGKAQLSAAQKRQYERELSLYFDGEYASDLIDTVCANELHGAIELTRFSLGAQHLALGLTPGSFAAVIVDQHIIRAARRLGASIEEVQQSLQDRAVSRL